MKGLSIIIVAYNQFEYAKLALQSIRLFGDIEDMSVILVDNGSTDGLRDWASEEKDFTYIFMDEGKKVFGSLINQVCKTLNLSDDLLIMDASFALTPKCLSRMRDTLYQDERVGAVGAKSNGFQHDQKVEGMSNYEEAIVWADQAEAIPNKRVMELAFQAVLFKKEVLEQLGPFEESMRGRQYVVKDYCLRMILNDWKLMICNSALLWKVDSNYEHMSAEDERYLENRWKMHYFNLFYNENLIQLITGPYESPICVMEIGCDCGATLLEIQNRYPNACVYGSEINENAAKVASHFATVAVNNIENQDLGFEHRSFDYIIFGDVLEHLRNPEEAIVYCKNFLKDDGCIIASIPNLMHISVMEQLLQGNFTYTETGLLDKTHIHFFTFYEIVQMFHSAGYELEAMGSVSAPISEKQNELIENLCMLGHGVEKWMYETFQYTLRARMKK